jgi:EAL domain-containing protein (putative c-di-GMP-specific phosphodiesterase class I)
MYESSFSFEEISLFLGKCNITIPPDVIKEYFERAAIRRLAAVEQKIADYYRPEWNWPVERTASIEKGLRKSLDEGRGFVLHYQPQVNMYTGHVVGAEALIRWECNGTLVNPAEFIPVAEGSNLIVGIGEWALREACREAKRWKMLGLGGEQGIKIGVNLSVKQFSDELPGVVHGVLCDTGLSTNLLGLEITESFLADKRSLYLLHELSNNGIHLSIDDFGTGYSCLSQLNSMPLDTIKIDRSFVVGLEQARSTAPVVEAIINLAHKYDMTTLAEGVETEAQAESLKQMGCSVCQGYLYSRPLPAAEFVQFAGMANRLLIQQS